MIHQIKQVKFPALNPVFQPQPNMTFAKIRQTMMKIQREFLHNPNMLKADRIRPMVRGTV